MRHCPYCNHSLKKFGRFYHRDKRCFIQRYRCGHCLKTSSSRSFAKDKHQKKSSINKQVAFWLCSGISLRRISQGLGVSYSTVYRKFLWLGELNNMPSFKKDFETLYFDEMESIEHTKLKPLTIALAVDEHYQIHGVKVGRIPAKGRLAEASRKKYGPRQNQSKACCNEVLSQLKDYYPKKIVTDKKPSYGPMIKKLFPKALHLRSSRKVNEEPFLKHNKKKFDPIFPLNQRCAKLRSDTKRLVRRSWCTTKKLENLELHLKLYQAFNNGTLIC